MSFAALENNLFKLPELSKTPSPCPRAGERGGCSSGSKQDAEQRCSADSTHVWCLEKPQGQQKPFKSQHLSTATTRARCRPCPCSQALLFPTKGAVLQHSTYLAPTQHPGPACKTHLGSPAAKKSKGSRVNGPTTKVCVLTGRKEGGETKSLLEH